MTVPAPKNETLLGRPASTGFKHRNQIEHEKKMSELDGRMAYLKARMDELKGGHTGSAGASADGTSPRGKLVGELKALREKMRPLIDERRGWAKEAAELRETLKKRSGELKEAKDKLPFKSVPEIEACIAEYEKKLETGNFRLSEEKQIVTEISKLNKAKKALVALDSTGSKSNDLGAMKLRVDVLQDKIKARDFDLDASRASIDAISAKLDALNGTLASERVSREERQAQYAKLRAEMDECYEARRKAIAENKARREAAFEAKLKREARQKEDDRRAQILERIEDLEERLSGHNPESLLDKKLAECSNMMSFFKALVGGEQKSTEVVETKTAPPACRAVTASEEIAGLEVVKKEDDVLYFGAQKASRKKGLKPSKGTSSASSALGKFPIHVLAGLTDLNLAIPSTSEQLPILLAALGQVHAAIVQKKGEVERSGERQQVDPKTQALIDQIAVLKLELDKKPEEPAVVEAA